MNIKFIKDLPNEKFKGEVYNLNGISYEFNKYNIFNEDEKLIGTIIFYNIPSFNDSTYIDFFLNDIYKNIGYKNIMFNKIKEISKYRILYCKCNKYDDYKIKILIHNNFKLKSSYMYKQYHMFRLEV